MLGEWVRFKQCNGYFFIFCKNDDMKSKLFLFLFSSWIFFGLPSSAEWKSLLKTSNGDVHYIDFESLKRDGEYVFFWSLRDYAVVNKWGDLSSKKYLKVDCKRSRFKFLKDSYHNQKMGQGIPVEISNEPDKEWTDIKSNGVMAFFLEKVCI